MRHEDVEGPILLALSLAEFTEVGSFMTPLICPVLAGVDVLPLFRLLYAQVAASCSALATALQLRKGLKHVRRFYVASREPYIRI